jgi:3-polyprenyl-4-hydroxybenzoate decarboxylase
LERAKRFPLLYCEKVEGGEAPVVINVQASRKLMALALACKPEELAAKFTERQGKPLAPVEVTGAPVQEAGQFVNMERPGSVTPPARCHVILLTIPCPQIVRRYQTPRPAKVS